MSLHRSVRPGQTYETVGARSYGLMRRSDPRIEALVGKALGEVASILNVGAGSGSYEPNRGFVVAVEPSLTMIRQRPPGAAAALRASAAALPFEDSAFDAALAILTVHHWVDRVRGLMELRRIARDRVVILTWVPTEAGFWLLDDYFPEILKVSTRVFPALEEIGDAIGPISILDVPIPHDCSDGFLGAYWRRPDAYLNSDVRCAMSSLSAVEDIEATLGRLGDDLRSGEWRRRHGHLLSQESMDLGYRLVVTA